MTDLGHIRAVALDFDGTLIEAGERIRDAAREAIARAAEAGIAVCTASGRPPDNQVMILAKNGLGPETGHIAALCCDERSVWLLNGTDYEPYRTWNDTMEAAWERLMPQAVALLDAGREELCAAGLPCEPHVQGDKIRERGLIDLKFNSESEATEGHRLLAERVAAVTDELMVSSNWHLVQILPCCGGKGNSVAAMARALGLAPREMLAIGDRNNDTTMLNGSAGLTPAAVGNAVPEIQALVLRHGGYVATAELGAGVAEILDQVLADRAAHGSGARRLP